MMPSNHLILYCPLLLLPSIFSSIRVFQMCWLFTSGCGSIGASASALVLPMNIQKWLSLGLTGVISLLSKGLSRVFNTAVQKHQLFRAQPFLMVQLSHLSMTTAKAIALTIRTFVSKVMSLLFVMLSRFAIAFLPRNKRLLISLLQSPSAVILDPRKIKSATVSPSFPMKWWGQTPWS